MYSRETVIHQPGGFDPSRVWMTPHVGLPPRGHMQQQRPPTPAYYTDWPGQQASYSGVGRRPQPVQRPRPTLPWLQSRWPAPSTPDGAPGRASTSRGLVLGTPPNPPARERVTLTSLPCSVPCSGLEILSSQPQDSDDITRARYRCGES